MSSSVRVSLAMIPPALDSTYTFAFAPQGETIIGCRRRVPTDLRRPPSARGLAPREREGARERTPYIYFAPPCIGKVYILGFAWLGGAADPPDPKPYIPRERPRPVFTGGGGLIVFCFRHSPPRRPARDRERDD